MRVYQHRCDGGGKRKVSFNQRVAYKKAARFNKLSDEPMCAYHCKSCGYYHVGHNSRKDKPEGKHKGKTSA